MFRRHALAISGYRAGRFVDRALVERARAPEVHEIILALNATVEGQTTAISSPNNWPAPALPSRTWRMACRWGELGISMTHPDGGRFGRGDELSRYLRHRRTGCSTSTTRLSGGVHVFDQISRRIRLHRRAFDIGSRRGAGAASAILYAYARPLRA